MTAPLSSPRWLERADLGRLVAALAEGRDELAAESADLLYHLMVLWAAGGIKPRDVWVQLAKREGVSGLLEKAMRGNASQAK